MNGSVLMNTNVTVRDFPSTSLLTQDEVNSRILFKLEEQERKMDQMNYLIQELILGNGASGAGGSNISFIYDENGNLTNINK